MNGGLIFEGRVWGSTCSGQLFGGDKFSSNHTYLVIYQPPLLKERVHPHDSTNISGKITATGCNGKILDGVQSVGVDHEISVVLVDGGSLATIPCIEEFRQGLLLDGMEDRKSVV